MGLKPVVAAPSAVRSAHHRHRSSLVGRLLSSNRYVLGLALVLAIGLPELLHGHVAHFGPWFEIRNHGFEPSLLAAMAAIVFSHLSLQRLGVLPLISARSLILPTFIMAFGASTLALFIARIWTDRYHIWTAFLIGLAWYYAVAMARSRYLKPTIGLIGVPLGHAQGMAVNIHWLNIAKPALHRHVSAVVVDPHASLGLTWSQFIARLVLDGVPVYHRLHFEEGLTGRVRFLSDADNNFGALLPSLSYLRIKRFIDLAGSLLAMPLVLPILAVAALAIRLDSKGPVMFTQVRTGYRGLPFICYKLRTMRVDLAGPDFTREDDPRISRVGRVLRKWRIDELPQVFNILKGEMSWIGPRPEAEALASEYAMHVPFYDYRHAVLPGISGWAAVHQGNVANVEAASLKLEYDFFYIRYFSIWLDFLILLKTLRAVWTGFGSR